MNQRDYKAIAEIIGGNIDKSKNGYVWKWNDPREVIHILADYFEKDMTPKNACWTEQEWDIFRKETLIPFRKQFLKDCGVE